MLLYLQQQNDTCKYTYERPEYLKLLIIQSGILYPQNTNPIIYLRQVY